MGISVTLPEINISEEELKLLLAVKLLDEGLVSLGKASEIAGYSEKAFVEILLHKGIAPVKFQNLNFEKNCPMSKVIIFDTSVLIALEKIGLQQILCKIYQEIILPETAVKEFGTVSIGCYSTKKVESRLIKILM